MNAILPLLVVEDVAAILRVSVATIRRDPRKFGGFRITDGEGHELSRRWYFSHDAIEGRIRGSQVPQEL